MKNIAVIFGGRSAEHDISIITAHIPIINTLLTLQEYDVWPVYIAKSGAWYANKAMDNLSFFRDAQYEAKLCNPISLSLNEGLTIFWPGMFGKSQKIDLVFPAMHGTYGEDGSLMGILRMANVPFVGCDIFGSAVAMDKVFTKQVVAAEGISVVPYVWFTRVQWTREADALLTKIAALKYPLFVKPVHMGSSIGITKVKKTEELEHAIEIALHYDTKVLIEESVDPLLEITLPIMGNDQLTFAHCERPLNKTEFFDFQDKYLSGGKGGKSGGVNNAYSEVPAQISDELTAQIQDMGARVYRALDCAGIARVDFLVNAETKQVYVNEVNTLPGSLYNHNWKKRGISDREIIMSLIRLAQERHESQAKTTFTFSSDVLKAVGGPKMQG